MRCTRRLSDSPRPACRRETHKSTVTNLSDARPFFSLARSLSTTFSNGVARSFLFSCSPGPTPRAPKQLHRVERNHRRADVWCSECFAQRVCFGLEMPCLFRSLGAGCDLHGRVDARAIVRILFVSCLNQILCSLSFSLSRFLWHFVTRNRTFFLLL